MALPVNNDFVSYFLDFKNFTKRKGAPAKKITQLLEFLRRAFEFAGIILKDAAVELIFVLLFGFVRWRLCRRSCPGL